ARFALLTRARWILLCNIVRLIATPKTGIVAYLGKQNANKPNDMECREVCVLDSTPPMLPLVIASAAT
ncbi:MAG: hypothetical protein K2F85_00545, partial [Helicobacter sp.]|nr:hypothetical protein [Helicobacter sp.]